MGRIEQLPFTTLDGLRVKARAFAWCSAPSRERAGEVVSRHFPLLGKPATDERLLRSMVQALVDMGLPASATRTKAA